MNMLEAVDACIFDLDGTLLDSMHVWQKVDEAYLARYGIEFDPSFSEEIKKMTFKESAVYFIEKFNIPKSEKEIMNDWNEMVEREYQFNIPLKAGAREFLARLKHSGIKMCVATSCNKKHALLALERLQIIDYFDFVKTCKDVGKNKEHPDIYIECAKNLNSEISNIMVFEDLLMALQVAKNEGFKTCGIKDILSIHEESEIKQVCDYYLESFEELSK